MSAPFALIAASMTGAAVAVRRGSAPRRRLVRSAERSAAARWTTWRGRALVARIGARRADSDVVGTLLDGWTANLRAGLPIEAALATAVAQPTGTAAFSRTAAAVQVGADAGPALRLDAAALSFPPDRRAALASTACWSVAREHGGRLADALDRVADALRADRLHVAHVRAQLAGPRATARLLAALPLVGLLMAGGLGLDPLHALVADRLGRLVLVAGVALDGAGLAWTARIARAAERAA